MKNKIVNFAMVIFVITFIVNGVYLIRWVIDNVKTDQVMDKIEDKVVIKEVEITEGTTTTSTTIKVNPNEPTTTTTNKPNIYYDYTKLSLIDVDFTELLKINKDTKGWLQVKGTNINYPYVQTDDNKYYLTRSFDKKYTDAGWVFMDYRNDENFYHKNTIIYAHARKNNTMFGELDKLLKNTYYKNKDNHFIYTSTQTENSVWQVFSVYHLPTTSDYLKISFSTNKEFLEFANMLKERSSRNFRTEITENDKILTLSTCYNDEEKLVVHAKLIKTQKK